jgi:hypothetical protein
MKRFLLIEDHKMKKTAWFVIISLILLFVVTPVMAQNNDELKLGLRRDFGYSSGTGKIQGTFTIKATGPENLVRVVFYLDDQVMGEATQSPFELRFITDNYSLGKHIFSAIGYTSDGREIRTTAEYPAEFVSAKEGWQSALVIAGPILGITALVLLVAFGSMLFSSGKLKNLPPGTPRNYGAAGGSICPKCHRPFARHIMSPNMRLGKLERCPFCGKWSVVTARPIDELRAAEAAELADSQAGKAAAQSEEEKLRKDLDNSRYQDI